MKSLPYFGFMFQQLDKNTYQNYDLINTNMEYELILYNQVLKRRNIIGKSENIRRIETNNYITGSREQNKYLEEINNDMDNVKQDGNTNVKQDDFRQKNCKEMKKELLEAIKISIVKDWLPKQHKTILIGPWAYDWLNLQKDLCVNVEKIQLISEMDPQELLNNLQRYVYTLSKSTISLREQELHIPKDFRISRYTYYIQIKSERGIVEKPFLDLFNCAQFDVIPYQNIDGIQVGYKWVILRFLFIDLWIIKLIKKLGLLTEKILEKKIEYIWNLVKYFHDNIIDGYIEYLGVYHDYMIDKKMATLSNKRFYTYVPDMYKKINGKYRHI
jgi:hypothetical protein